MRAMDLMSLGMQHLKAGRPREAVPLFAKAIAGGVTDASIYYQLGNAYLALEQPTHAYVAFREAVSRMTNGHSQDTREAFEKALRNVQRHRAAAASITIESLLTLPEQSVAHDHGFRKDTYTFVDISPNAQSLAQSHWGMREYFDAAGAAHSRGQIGLSVDLLKAAVNAAASFAAKAKALSLAACLLAEVGQLENALRLMGWAVELAPGDADVLRLRAKLMAMLEP